MQCYNTALVVLLVRAGLSLLYTVSEKSLQFFLNNSEKFKLTFINFGARYHYDTLY